MCYRPYTRTHGLAPVYLGRPSAHLPTTVSVHSSAVRARVARSSPRAYIPLSVGMQRVAMELMRALAGSCCHALVAVRQPLK